MRGWGDIGGETGRGGEDTGGRGRGRDSEGEGRGRDVEMGDVGGNRSRRTSSF